MKKRYTVVACLLLATFLTACGEPAGSAPPFLAEGTTMDTSAAPASTTQTEASTQTEVPAQTEAPVQTEFPAQTETVPEEHDHNHVGYKGLTTADYTIEDMAAAEGRQADFTFVNNGATVYVYNDVELDGLHFSQVQYTFGETENRISCTSTADSELDTLQAQWQAAMATLYGEPFSSDGLLSWQDGHTANVVTLTALNETTLQLAFYFNA